MPPRFQLLPKRFTTQISALRWSQPSSRAYADAVDVPSPVVRNPLKRRKGGDLGSHLPRDIIPKDAYIPEYPFGNAKLFKQADKGLYGEQTIQFGNNVSDKTKTKTRRYWLPNVISKGLYSVTLKKKIKLCMTARVLRTVEREGGLDEYLLKDSENRIRELGPMGWALRWTLMQNPAVITRLRADAAALGVDQATIDKQWPTAEMMAEHKKSQSPQVSSNILESATFSASAGQEVWDPTAPPTRPPRSAEEMMAVRKAKLDYDSTMRACKRYVDRGYVNSDEEGIKLACIRLKERQESNERVKQAVQKQLAAISAEELEEVRALLNPDNASEENLRRMAYQQRRRKEIEAAGGESAWIQARDDAYRAKMGFVRTDPAVYAAQKKAEYGAALQEAETAATNNDLSPERREYLVNALNKADRIIKAKAAGGKYEYIKCTVEELYLEKTAGGNDLSELTDVPGTDAQAAVVDANINPEETGPKA